MGKFHSVYVNTPTKFYTKYEKEAAFSSVHLLASYLHIDVTKVKLASLYQIHNI